MATVRQCPKCQQPASEKTFTTENVLGHLFSAFSALVIMSVSAAFLITANEPLWRWGGGLVMGALAVFMFVQNALRLFNRSKHKVIEEHVL